MIFVEDPGAANYIAYVPSALAERGIAVQLAAAGAAIGQLRALGMPPDLDASTVAVDTLLADVAPRLVLIGTSENIDGKGLHLVPAARERGIPVVGFVDAASNAEFRFRGRSQDPLEFAPDWLLVPDEWTKGVYARIGYPDARIRICGHPHYDHVRELSGQLAREDGYALKRRVLPRADPDASVVVFVAEISTGLNPAQYRRSAEYTLQGRGASEGRTEIVLEELLDAIALLPQRPYVVLRLHPKNDEAEFARYAGEFDALSKGGSPLELVFCADLVVGMTSMLLLEAAIMGRPTLSIVPRALERDWLPTTRLGITPSAATRGDLRRALPSLIGGSTSAPADPEHQLLFGSVARITDFIAERVAER